MMINLYQWRMDNNKEEFRAILIIVIMLFVSTILFSPFLVAEKSGPLVPAPSSVDGVYNGAWFESPFGPYVNEYSMLAKRPAPNYGDGLLDGLVN